MRKSFQSSIAHGRSLDVDGEPVLQVPKHTLQVTEKVVEVPSVLWPDLVHALTSSVAL